MWFMQKVSSNNQMDSDEERGVLRKEAAKYQEKIEKRGVVYMSRVPPFMKPNKARTIFEQYGEVTRLFLSEEDESQRKKRKEHGGNASKQFNEGWIEFADKKLAKAVAESLNNTPIGGKKGDFYHDDIWNLKYLKGFKWDYLTEKFAYEKRVKENKLKMAMMQAKRNNAEIVELIEKTHVQTIISERKRKKGDNDDDDNNNDDRLSGNKDSRKVKKSDYDANNNSSNNDSNNSNKQKKQRKVHQNKMIGNQYGEQQESKIANKVLKNVFSHDSNK